MPVSVNNQDGPIAFRDMESYQVMEEAVQYVRRLMRTPSPESRPENPDRAESQPVLTSFLVTGARDNDGYYQAKEQFRNATSVSESTDWWDGDTGFALQCLDKEPLDVGEHYIGIITEFKHEGKTVAICMPKGERRIKIKEATPTGEDGTWKAKTWIRKFDNTAGFEEGVDVRVALETQPFDTTFRNDVIYKAYYAGEIIESGTTYELYHAEGHGYKKVEVCDEEAEGGFRCDMMYALGLHFEEDVDCEDP